MATQNPWSGLDPEQLQKLLGELSSQGGAALKSGLVSPDQAAANLEELSPILKQLGFGGGGGSVFDQVIRGPAAQKKAPAKPAAKSAQKKAMPVAPPAVNTPVPGTGGAVFQATPVPKGSGLYNRTENKDSVVRKDEVSEADIKTENEMAQNTNATGTNESATKAVLFSTPELQDQYENTMAMPAFRQQAQGISEIQDMLAMTGPGDALSNPLAALLTAEFKKDGSGFMTKNTPYTVRDQLLAGSSKLQDDKRDLFKSTLESMKAQRAGTQTESSFSKMLDLLSRSKGFREENRTNMGITESEGNTNIVGANDPLRSLGGFGSAGLADLRTKEKDVRDTINKTMEPFEGRFEQLQTAQAALKNNDWVSLTNTLSIMAKTIGAESGVLTQQDIARALPSTFKGDLTRLRAYLTSNPSAPIDPKLTAGLRDLVYTASKNMQLRYSASLERKIKQFKGSSGMQGVPVDEIASGYREQLKGIEKSIASFAPAKKKAPPPAGSIRVKQKSTGKVGYVPENKFDPAKHEKVE